MQKLILSFAVAVFAVLPVSADNNPASFQQLGIYAPPMVLKAPVYYFHGQAYHYPIVSPGDPWVVPVEREKLICIGGRYYHPNQLLAPR